MTWELTDFLGTHQLLLLKANWLQGIPSVEVAVATWHIPNSDASLMMLHWNIRAAYRNNDAITQWYPCRLTSSLSNKGCCRLLLVKWMTHWNYHGLNHSLWLIVNLLNCSQMFTVSWVSCLLVSRRWSWKVKTMRSSEAVCCLPVSGAPGTSWDILAMLRGW